MSTEDTSMVVFIGGPLHGTWKGFDTLPEYYAHDLPDGGMVPYTRRPMLALPPGYTIYAPVGMSLNAIANLVAAVSRLTNLPPDA
jgi:hypothetical protein